MPRDDGTKDCGREEQKWFYDTRIHVCTPFIYLGCRGNANNFRTYDECTQKCKTVSQTPYQPAPGAQHPQPSYQEKGKIRCFAYHAKTTRKQESKKKKQDERNAAWSSVLDVLCKKKT